MRLVDGNMGGDLLDNGRRAHQWRTRLACLRVYQYVNPVECYDRSLFMICSCLPRHYCNRLFSFRMRINVGLLLQDPTPIELMTIQVSKRWRTIPFRRTARPSLSIANT